ncbi:hypothetical protein KY317_02335 [Candidatus Woesearchaeota archaeon]|nr:hypothetical protein [Candidatus Woesearchaeota archaeon]
MDIILKGKKGISPLLATVMLLVLAVGLGVIVMNWGRASLEANAECSVNLGMKLVEVEGIPQICYSGSGEEGQISFIIENGANADISQIQMRIIGSKKVYATDLAESSIKRNYPLMKKLPYNFELFGDIKQIKLTPKVILFPDKAPVICSEQAIIIEGIKEC